MFSRDNTTTFLFNTANIQQSADSLEVGIKDIPVIRRCISLLLMVKGHSKGNVGTAVKCVDSRQKYKKHKGELHGGHNNGNSEGNTSNGGLSKTFNFCCLKGHEEAGCFK